MDPLPSTSPPWFEISWTGTDVVGEIDDAPRLAALRDRLETGLLETVPDIRRTGDPDHRLPNTSNIAFRGAMAGDLIARLDREGIAVSGASACHSGSGEPSESLIRGMGLSREEAMGSVRFSFGRGSTSEHVDRVLEVLPRVVAELRARD